MVVESINDTELRFKNPGRLLVLVIAFLFWGVGFLDLLGHKSRDQEILGLYSLPFFLFLLLYGSLLIVWILLFFNANLLSRVVDGIRYIQSKTWLVLIAFAGLGVVLWVILEWDRWSRLPGLQFSIFGLSVLAFGILLFTDWTEKKDQQVWRKFIAYPVFVLIALEVVLQALAWFGLLPGVHKIGGDFYPYERVYYNGMNDFANRYGWFYPDAQMDNNKKRILVIGGSYVQAIQIPPEEQSSVHLTELLNQDPTGEPVEVIPIGMPGFGLSPFLYDVVLGELPNIIKYDEMVVVFHLGDDFQSPSRVNNAITYTVSDTGAVDVDPEDAKLRHDLSHYYLRAYMSLQLVTTIRSNYLTPKVLGALFQGQDAAGPSTGEGEIDFPRLKSYVTDTYTITEPGHAGIKSTDLEVIPQGNNFMFLQTPNADQREAILVADSILQTAQEIARDHNFTLRIVTIPMFPEEFYSSSSNGQWDPALGEYDLLLPERALTEVANRYDIPIRPLGQYMLEDGLSAEEIEALYLSNDQGSFTPQGQDYLAEAIYSCFYSVESISLCPK